MKANCISLLNVAFLFTPTLLHAQVQPSPTATTSPGTHEQLPTLNADAILQAQYLNGPNFIPSLIERR